ncbi:hypothetical protein PUR28_01255, partial [Streptomyces sp. BE308]|uniref:hypothetical protein n=1 Tax=Streptomyces sp. BE308 TaxID=3002529 RepID=UPI002E79C5B3
DTAPDEAAPPARTRRRAVRKATAPAGAPQTADTEYTAAKHDPVDDDEAQPDHEHAEPHAPRARRRATRKATAPAGAPQDPEAAAGARADEAAEGQPEADAEELATETEEV